MGVVSKVVSTVRKIDGIYTMLEGAVKKIDEVYTFVEGKRRLVFPESALIFEKTTPGAYEFTVPEKYVYVTIEYAGAGGAAGTEPRLAVAVGRGAILKTQKITNKTITGIVASAGNGIHGGSGYNRGDNGSKEGVYSSGGGGGATSVEYAGNILVASGGAGQATFWSTSHFGDKYLKGGKGGGTYGGVPKVTAGSNDATDPNQIGLNSGDGYVRIYGIAG